MHYHTLRNTAAFLITTFACFNSAHAASKLVNIGTKQPEVKEIPQPPQELRDALNIHIDTTALQNIIYGYLRGSEIHPDHLRFLHYAYEDIGLYKSPPQLSPEFKFISRYIFTGKISEVDKKWLDDYLQADDHQGFLNIKNKCNTQNFFQYGFENFITIADHECIQVHKKHMLEYLLHSSESLTSPRDIHFNVQALCNMIKLLIEHKAPVNVYLEKQSKTPLRSAIDDFKNPALVQLMLEHKADPNYRCGFNKHGDYSSYLHLVNGASHPLIVQSLLDAKADPLRIQKIHTHPDVFVTPLSMIKWRASTALKRVCTPGATLDDNVRAKKLELLAKMFEDVASAQRQHLKQYD